MDLLVVVIIFTHYYERLWAADDELVTSSLEHATRSELRALFTVRQFTGYTLLVPCTPNLSRLKKSRQGETMRGKTIPRATTPYVCICTAYTAYTAHPAYTFFKRHQMSYQRFLHGLQRDGGWRQALDGRRARHSHGVASDPQSTSRLPP